MSRIAARAAQDGGASSAVMLNRRTGYLLGDLGGVDVKGFTIQVLINVGPVRSSLPSCQKLSSDSGPGAGSSTRLLNEGGSLTTASDDASHSAFSAVASSVHASPENTRARRVT